MEWQPIETAPKDGTNILLFIPEWRPEYQRVVGHWGRSFFGEKWFDNVGMKALSCRPSHWMPLPEPPK